MSLFKRKKVKKFIRAMVNLALLSIFLWQITNPAVVSAKSIEKIPVFSQKIEGLTISSTPRDRMFSPRNKEKQPDKKIVAVITAYSSTIDQCDDDPFIAASGKHVYDGMVAANFLPFGTKIKIPSLYGDKIFTVGDRMNAKYGYGRVDIWQDAPRAELLKFGVKRLKMEIY